MIRADNAPSEGIVLTGLDGSNPLAFLAALGTLLTLRPSYPEIRLSWTAYDGGWRALLWQVPNDPQALVAQIDSNLRQFPTDVFELDKKMPFSVQQFRAHAKKALHDADHRRAADFLAAFGTDAVTDGEDFADTLFRMVRSGDSAGQGFLYYALAIRQSTTSEALHETLFGQWLYQDKCFSLRWDPIEDAQYALRWEDPSKSDKNTMIGANSLALEALPLLPTMPKSNRLHTTGFWTHKRHEYFTWPIWNVPLSADIIRSVLSLDLLYDESPPRRALGELGIQELFRSRRYAPNQYYRNFTPARSV